LNEHALSPCSLLHSAENNRMSTSHPASWQTVLEIGRSLPEVKESISYGTRALRVRGKLFARQHQDGESLVIRIEEGERDALIQANPKGFYITDHYLGYPWILVRLATVSRADLRDLLGKRLEIVRSA
jgi:hypothetical protein